MTLHVGRFYVNLRIALCFGKAIVCSIWSLYILVDSPCSISREEGGGGGSKEGGFQLFQGVTWKCAHYQTLQVSLRILPFFSKCFSKNVLFKSF
jgi:hypothetical protein